MKSNETHILDTFIPEVQILYDNFRKEQIQDFDWMDELYYMETETEQETLFMTLLHQHQGIGRGIEDERFLIMSVLEWIEFFLFWELQELGLTHEKIGEYTKILQEKYTNNGKCSMMKFYYSLVFKHINTNIYLTGYDVFIKTEFEFDILAQANPDITKGRYIVLNLNSLASIQFQENFGRNAIQRRFLSEAEWDVVEEIRDTNFSKDEVKVKLKQGKIDMIQTIGKENDLNRLKELSDKYEDSKIGFQKYKGKKKHITIETRKKYDTSTS